jgi:hypothetical protein
VTLRCCCQLRPCALGKSTRAAEYIDNAGRRKLASAIWTFQQIIPPRTDVVRRGRRGLHSCVFRWGQACIPAYSA